MPIISASLPGKDEHLYYVLRIVMAHHFLALGAECVKLSIRTNKTVQREPEISAVVYPLYMRCNCDLVTVSLKDGTHYVNCHDMFFDPVAKDVYDKMRESSRTRSKTKRFLHLVDNDIENQEHP